jgi:hypothetical protein
VHLGVDLFQAAGAPVHAPCAGRVHSLANNASPGDYGPCVVLAHVLDVSTRVRVRATPLEGFIDLKLWAVRCM